MKRISTLLLVVFMMLSFSACGKEKAASSQSDQKPAFSLPTEDSAEAPTQIPTETTTVPTTEETEPPVQWYMEPIAARYWADTENGYHITESQKDPYKNQYLCIDAEGFVTVALDMDTEKVQTGVYDDVFVTTADNAVYIRSAADGKIIFEHATDENTVAFPMTDGIKDGYAMYIVHKSETYNGVSYEIGFVDTKGKWVLQMTSDSPLFNCFDDGGTIYDFQKLRYCGEDLLVFRGKEFEAFLYRITDNQLIEISHPTDSDFNFYYPTDSVEFKNTLSSPYSLWGGDYTLPHADGTGETIVNKRDIYDNNTHIENTYFDYQTKTIYGVQEKTALTFEESVLYVSDNTGRILKEYPHTVLEHTEGFYQNGTAPVIIKNQEGSLFMTVLDTTGEFLYEPIKITCQVICDVSTGFSYAPFTSQGSGTQFINSQGQIVHSVDQWTKILEKRNGIIRYQMDYQDYFLEVE